MCDLLYISEIKYNACIIIVWRLLNIFIILLHVRCVHAQAFSVLYKVHSVAKNLQVAVRYMWFRWSQISCFVIL